LGSINIAVFAVKANTVLSHKNYPKKQNPAQNPNPQPSALGELHFFFFNSAKPPAFCCLEKRCQSVLVLQSKKTPPSNPNCFFLAGLQVFQQFALKPKEWLISLAPLKTSSTSKNSQLDIPNQTTLSKALSNQAHSSQQRRSELWAPPFFPPLSSRYGP